MRKSLFHVFIFFVFSSAGFAQQGKLPLEASVRTGKLANGLTYYIRENKLPENRAELYLVNKVGSILEDENQLGLAHFVEHMAFNGTRDFPKNEMLDYLQKAGVKFGADINAYTSFDETVYQLPIPSDTASVFEKGFDILLNWAGFVSFDPEEVNAERGVILEEARQRGKNAQERMQQQALPILFNNSRYAERLPIGKEEVLKNFSVETIKKFYNDWYRPDLQAVIAVGDFNADAVEKMIKEKFSVLKNPASPRPRVKYEVDPHSETYAKVITDKEFPYTVAQILYKQPYEAVQTAVQLREQIKTELFNTMMAERLQEITRKPEAPFFFAQNAVSPFTAGQKALIAIGIAKNGMMDKTIATLMEEMERVRKFGFGQAEMERAKKAVLQQRESIFKEKDKTKSSAYVSAYQNHFLNGTAVPGTEFIYDFYKKEVPGITLQEVNDVLNEFEKNENRIVLIQAPSKDSAALPSREQLLAWVNADHGNVTAYEDMSSNEPLLSEIPTGSKVTATKSYPEIGAERITLGNGVKIWLKPTNFKNDEIRFSSYSFGGTSLVPDTRLPELMAAGNIMSQSGVGQFDPIALGKMLVGKKLGVSPYVSEIGEGVSGFAAPADLETALQLVYLYHTAIRKDTTAFRTAIAEMKYMLQNKELDPESVFEDTISAVMSNYHPRRMSPTLEMLDQVSLDEVVNMYKERFANASDAVFVMVGNFKKDSILPLLEKYLGALPAQGKAENFRNLNIKPMPGAVTKTVYKGAEEKTSVKLVFHGPMKWSAENNLRLNALGEILLIKMNERLREKEEGVYAPRVSAGSSKLPDPRFSVSISFTCDPKNTDKLIAAALDEVRKIKNNGPEADDMQKLKAEAIRSHELQIKENGFWLGYLSRQSQYNDPVAAVNEYETLLKNLNAEDVKKAAQLLDEKSLIRLILMPEKK